MSKDPRDDVCSIPLLCVTTSERKFAHLRYLGDEHGIEMFHVPREYEELQEDDLEVLLEDALNRDILTPLRDTFFIIEQTSVFFEAYDREPGQFFKRWWRMKSEEDLKYELSQNPTAEIESGLALNIPNHDPLVRINNQTGRVSFEGSVRNGNEEYPWLSGEDFNLYFIPEGATKVYNQMDLREFRKYDFRRPNFESISERLYEYSSILEAELSISELRRKAKELESSWSSSQTQQLGLDDYDT